MTSVGIIILGTRVFTELVCCSVLCAYSYVCPWFITQYLWEEKNQKSEGIYYFLCRFFFFFQNMVGSCQHSIHQFSSVQSFSRVQLFATPWTTAHQASLPITNSWSPPKPMSIESMPFSSCPQSFPASRSFQMSQFFASGGQKLEFWLQHQSFLPINSQDCFPSGWTGWISLQSKELSRDFSNTTVQKHQLFGA